MLQLKLKFKVNEDWNWPCYLSFLNPFLILYLFGSLLEFLCHLFVSFHHSAVFVVFFLTCFFPVLRQLQLTKYIMDRLISKFFGLLSSWITCVSLPIWCIVHRMITKFRDAKNFQIIRYPSTNIAHHLKWSEGGRIWWGIGLSLHTRNTAETSSLFVNCSVLVWTTAASALRHSVVFSITSVFVSTFWSA